MGSPRAAGVASWLFRLRSGGRQATTYCWSLHLSSPDSHHPCSHPAAVLRVTQYPLRAIASTRSSAVMSGNPFELGPKTRLYATKAGLMCCCGSLPSWIRMGIMVLSLLVDFVSCWRTGCRARAVLVRQRVSPCRWHTLCFRMYPKLNI